MKNLLIVSYCFPPQLAPESLLLLRRVKELARLGWHLTVLTSDPDATLERLDPRLAESLPPSLGVVRAGRALYPLFAIKVLAKLILKPLTFLGLPEMQFPWYFFGLRAGRRLVQEKRFTAIYSHAFYHVSSLVALALKRLTGLPWLAYFSDPWVDNPYLRLAPLQRRMSGIIEAAIIREADAVVFVTRQTAEVVMRKYPQAWRKKVHVIPHGYEPDNCGNPNPTPAPRPRLRLVYTGMFYKGKRTPEGLFKALQLLGQTRPLAEQLEVRLIGPFVPDYQGLAQSLGLDQVVSCSGPIPFTASLQEAAAADVLLVIEAPNNPSLILPTKLVDALAFKKPILGLVPQDGPPADLLRQLGCPLAAPDDVEGIARALGGLLDLWQEGKLTVSPSLGKVARQYEIQETTHAFNQVLDELTPGGSEE
jgi:glycosyltransferase involved in cell wall biosynthesis